MNVYYYYYYRVERSVTTNKLGQTSDGISDRRMGRLVASFCRPAPHLPSNFNYLRLTLVCGGRTDGRTRTEIAKAVNTPAAWLHVEGGSIKDNRTRIMIYRIRRRWTCPRPAADVLPSTARR